MMYHITKFFGKLNKRQTDEIGTLKSPTKPLYLVKRNINELNLQKEGLEKLKNINIIKEDEINQNKKEILQEEQKLEALREIEKISNESKIEEEKILIHINAKDGLEKNRQELQQELSEIEVVKKNSSSTRFLYIIPVLLIILSLGIFMLLDKIVGAIFGIFSILSFFIVLLKNRKESNIYRKAQEEYINRKKNIENKIQLIENEIEVKDKDIKSSKESLELSMKIKKDRVKSKYPNINEYYSSSERDILEEQNHISKLSLSLTRKELELNSIKKDLEKLNEIEEKLYINSEIYKELIEYDEAIEIAKETLRSSYIQMRETITPKFTQNLSNAINNITSGKYKTVKTNDDGGLSLETENRKLC